MGLAISKSIVESHGGRIWANGDGAPGATFHFTLPAAVVEVSRQYDSEFLRRATAASEPCLSTLICDKKDYD